MFLRCSIIYKLSVFHCYNHIFLIFTIPSVLHLPSLSIHSCSIAKNYAHKSSSTTSSTSSISSFNLSPTQDCQNPSNNKSSLLFLSFHHQSLQVFPTLTFLPSFSTVLSRQFSLVLDDSQLFITIEVVLRGLVHMHTLLENMFSLKHSIVSNFPIKQNIFIKLTHNFK